MVKPEVYYECTICERFYRGPHIYGKVCDICKKNNYIDKDKIWTKFKVGDRVRFIDEEKCGNLVGATGEIISMNDGSFAPVGIKLDKHIQSAGSTTNLIWAEESVLELIKPLKLIKRFDALIIGEKDD